MAKITQADLDEANASDDPIGTLAALKEGKGSTTRSLAPATTPKGRKDIVTKEELAASGLSLRDYLNKQRGLTRRDGSAVEPAPSAKSASAGAGRGSRGGPTADELDSYAAGAKQRAYASSKRPSDAEMAGDAIESSHPEELLIGGPGIKAIASLAKAAAKGTAAAARSASRALAEKGADEVTFLGRSGARNVTPPERLPAPGPKRLGSDDAAQIANNPTKRLPAPEAEAPARDVVMRRKAWEEGPRGELGDNARDRIFDRDFWTRGPSADMKKGGKVKTKAYAAGGAVKGWGKARGARGAKIV